MTYDKAFPAPMICDPPYEANHKVGSQLIGDDVTVTLLDSVPSTQDEERNQFRQRVNMITAGNTDGQTAH
ncbi:MAG: hypothetical protein R3B91_17835 [Planctomycetaceae bacterium]